MTETIIRCDICNARNAISFGVVDGYQTPSCAGDDDNTYFKFDLCPKHVQELFYSLFGVVCSLKPITPENLGKRFRIAIENKNFRGFVI